MNELMNISSALANSDLFKSLQDTTDALAGSGGSGHKRISLKGGKFRLKVNGDQVGAPRSDALNIVIVEAGELSRTFYSESYNPDNLAAPTCWSSNSTAPDESVPEAQRKSDNCKTCPMAIKGSGQGSSAACRFSQRLAVALDSELEEDEIPIYQLSIPAKSIFGAAENGHMPIQAYGKMLKSHKAPAIAVVTEMYFDENSETPKLFFKPNRMLTEAELTRVVAMRGSDAVKEAIEMSVHEADGSPQKEFVEEAPKEEVKKAAPVEEVEEVEEEEVIEEPVKVTKKKATPDAEVDDELAGLIDDWDE